MFVCKDCTLMLPATEFRVHKSGYRIGKCRGCERAYQREWSRRDPETYRRRKRESMARRRAENPDAAREYARRDHAQNRDARTTAMREYTKRRFFWTKAMKLRGDFRASAKDLASLWRQQKGLCALTGRRMDRTAQLDHINARARGGSDDVANLRWLCKEANLARRELSDKEFVALCFDVMSWIGQRIHTVTEAA